MTATDPILELAQEVADVWNDQWLVTRQSSTDAQRREMLDFLGTRDRMGQLRRNPLFSYVHPRITWDGTRYVLESDAPTSLLDQELDNLLYGSLSWSADDSDDYSF